MNGKVISIWRWRCLHFLKKINMCWRIRLICPIKDATSQPLCSLFGSSSQLTVFFSHTAPAPASSHQPANSVFLSHHSSTSHQHQHNEQSGYATRRCFIQAQPEGAGLFRARAKRAPQHTVCTVWNGWTLSAAVILCEYGLGFLNGRWKMSTFTYKILF